MASSAWRARLEELGAELGAGASAEELTKAEAALGQRLPAEYRSFLVEVGWAEIGALSIAGLGRGVPEDLDLLRAARAAWDQGEIPRELLPLADDGGGDFLFLELASGAVVYLSNGVREPLAPSFTLWLEEELAGFEGEE